MKTKIVFFGTGNFGAAMLDALFKSGYDPVLVITQPDRLSGRKMDLTKPPVKLLSETYGLRIEQPESLKNYQLERDLFEIAVVCQYGLIIPESILNTPKRGAINVHASLLPLYRGASPLQSSIMNGDTETGVTIMLMDKKMDHGKILAQKPVPIGRDETYPELRKKMEPVAAQLLLAALSDYLNDKITAVDQDDSKATYCRILSRDDGKINWNNPANKIYDQYRGLYPWPGIWTLWKGKRVKLTKITLSGTTPEKGQISVEKGSIFAGCGNGSVEILELQIEGKRNLPAKDFISGYPDLNGSFFDDNL